MGEARRRRAAFTKRGLIELAKAPENNAVPDNLVHLTVLVKQNLAVLIDKRYEEDVNHAAVPSRNTWIERLLVAGLVDFDREKKRQAEEHSLIKLAGPKEMAQVTGGIAQG